MTAIRARPRVLLVDDHEAMLTRAGDLVSASCTVVGAARDGRAAMYAAATLQPDVIILDICMPGMNGFEVAAALRDSGSTAALIFSTAHPDEEVMDVSLAAGAVGYVIKQRLFTDLAHAVCEARAGRRFVSPLD